MGLVYYREKDLVTVVSEGDLGFDEIRSTFSEIRGLSLPSSGLQILIVDNRSEFNPDQQQVREIVTFWIELFKDVRVRIALVVAKESHFGIGRMAMSLGERSGLRFRVFRERAEALAWLSATSSA